MSVLARKDLYILIFLWVTFSTLFLVIPSIDIMVSQLFFDLHTGTFPLATSPLIQHLNNLGHSFIFILAFWPVLAVLVKKQVFPLYPAFLYVTFYIFSVYILIEFGVKEFWLRPRPEQIKLFGGLFVTSSYIILDILVKELEKRILIFKISQRSTFLK